jgi:sortase A
MVREGIDDGTLRKAAGHVPSTALPGQTGDFVVLGHRDTFFRPLRAVEQGDVVRMRTRHGQFTYRIDSVAVVDLEGLRAIREAPGEAITLITCYPFDYIGPAPRRLIARGSLDSEP